MSIPTGWKLVPIEPTPEMLRRIDNDESGAPYCYDHYIVRIIWETMIADSPEPPK